MIPKINSAHGPDTRNIINRVIDLINVQGKSIQDLVAKGQLTPTQYADLIKEINGLISKGDVKPDDLSPQLLELIHNSDGTPFEILSIPRDKSVTPRKTTFAGKGKNKFDGYLYGYIISGGVGGAVLADSNDNGITAIVEVKPNTTYTVSRGNTNSGRFRVATSETFPEVGQNVNLFGSSDSWLETTVTTRSNDNYLIVYVSNTGIEADELQIEEGSARTYYESHDNVIIKHSDGSVDTRALKDINSLGVLTGANNQFNVSIIEENITVGAAAYLTVGESRYVMASGNYSFSDFSAQSVIVAFDTKSRTIVYLTSGTITYPENREYPILGIVRRDQKTQWFNGLYSVEGSSVDAFTRSVKDDIYDKIEEARTTGGTGGTGEPTIFIADDTRGNYKTESSYTYPYNYVVDDFYSMYDNLVSTYPEYVTKSQLGTDEAGYAIYRYDFKPVSFGSVVHPKVVYTSFTHGHEIAAAYGGATFFNELCSKWSTNDALRTLRFNVHFIVVPCLNPWGLVNKNRKNSNGVDLNRNFPTGWTLGTDPSAVDYGGESPLTEIGSQVMHDIMQTETGVLFAVDHHNFGPDAMDGQAIWTSSNDPNTKKMLDSYTQLMYVNLMSNYTIPEGTVIRPIITNTPVGGGMVRHWVEQGVSASLLETIYHISNSHNEGQHFTDEAIGNIFLSALRSKY